TTRRRGTSRLPLIRHCCRETTSRIGFRRGGAESCHIRLVACDPLSDLFLRYVAHRHRDRSLQEKPAFAFFNEHHRSAQLIEPHLSPQGWWQCQTAALGEWNRSDHAAMLHCCNAFASPNSVSSESLPVFQSFLGLNRCAEGRRRRSETTSARRG